MGKKSRGIREKSGNITSRDRLVMFLYELMRDHLTPGKVEEIMMSFENCEEEECLFTNGWLAQYAQDIAKRLK